MNILKQFKLRAKRILENYSDKIDSCILNIIVLLNKFDNIATTFSCEGHDNNGFTIAHIAAKNGYLPADFTNWGLADKNGWTVAHLAAYNGHLPSDFTGWDWKDDDGWTVAHSAACNGRLPSNFTGWDWVDNKGRTVRQVYEEYLDEQSE